VTVFRLDVRDQITFGTGRYVNVARTRATGVEADAKVRLTDDLTLKGGYAFDDAVDRATGAQLIRVPRNTGSLSLLWRHERWSGAFTLRAEDRQADSDPSTFSRATRPGFAVADLAGAYRVNDRIELTARVENLTDRHYQQSLGYGEPRAAVYLGVRLKD
jgi:vitamin B12 transporter